MTRLTDHYASRFLFNNELYRMNIDGFGEEQARIGPAGGGNSAAWIAGHLTSSRIHYLRSLGAKPEPAGEFDRYKRGSQSTPEGGFLPLEQVSAKYLELGVELAKFIGSISAERLEETGPQGLPAVRTIADAIGFFHMHECYHLGQLGLARRVAGLKGAIA